MKKKQKNINLNFIFSDLEKIYIIFQKNKNKLLLLVFKNQTSWKIYIFKIVYIKNN